MADANQIQLRSGRRAVALLLAGCVVFANLAVLRHESTVAHVRGALSGELEHAHELAEFHERSTTPHLHVRNVEVHADGGVCALLAALDHATVLPGGPNRDADHSPGLARRGPVGLAPGSDPRALPARSEDLASRADLIA